MQKIRLPRDKKTFWVAVYGPDEYLCQYNEDNKENLFGDIDLERVTQFVFVDRSIPENPVEISVDTSIGALKVNGINWGQPDNQNVKLIFFKRQRVDIAVGPGSMNPGAPQLAFYGIGYEFNEKDGKNTKRLIKYKDHTIL